MASKFPSSCQSNSTRHDEFPAESLVFYNYIPNPVDWDPTSFSHNENINHYPQNLGAHLQPPQDQYYYPHISSSFTGQPAGAAQPPPNLPPTQHPPLPLVRRAEAPNSTHPLPLESGDNQFRDVSGISNNPSISHSVDCNSGRDRVQAKVSQACDACRQRKTKCNKAKPRCVNCESSNLACTYFNNSPPRNQKLLNTILKQLKTLIVDVGYLKELSHAQQPKPGCLVKVLPETRDHQPRKLESVPGPSEIKLSGVDTPFENHHKEENRMGSASSRATVAWKSAAIANPLAWPMIEKLIASEHTVPDVMEIDSTRDLLRLHGCGEGKEKSDMHEAVWSWGPSGSPGHTEMEILPPFPSGVGDTDQFLPPLKPSSNRSHEHVGSLSPHDSLLLLDVNAIDQNVWSYLHTMYTLHPFLDKQSLHTMVTTFKHEYGWDCGVDQRVVSDTSRQQQCEDYYYSLSNFLPNDYSRSSLNYIAPPSMFIKPSITNAIVLLVLALGEICAHEGPLPEMNGSSPTTTANGSLPQGQNMDVVPGLAYFTKAATILGAMAGGVDLLHAQANLLAGLYMGQLGRTLPSLTYIRNAGTACQVIIHTPSYQQNLMSPAQRHLVNFTVLTCLQLESEVLAELNLPSTGILTAEYQMLCKELMQMPLNGIPGADSGNATEKHRHYAYPIRLQNIVGNCLAQMFHGDTDDKLPSRNVIENFGKYLEDFRWQLNDWNWNDNDYQYQSTDINAARLRAKYYAAAHLIHRPVLYCALHFFAPSTAPSYPPFESPESWNQNNSQEGDSRPTPLMRQLLEDWVVKASMICVHAAVRSTTCFDKIPRRLFVPNIFGIAHTQFENVLVIAATYCSQHPQLRDLISESEFRWLLERTIGFLKLHEQVSPSLSQDIVILQQVRARIFSQSKL